MKKNVIVFAVLITIFLMHCSHPGDMLIDAAYTGNLFEVERLLKEGMEIDYISDKGVTALIVAASWGHIQIVELLLESGADINIEDYNGMTALQWAVCNGNTKIVELLKTE